MPPGEVGLTGVSDSISIVPDAAHFDAGVEALYARAFGPGRFAKAAARLREGNNCLRNASFLAMRKGALVGACRMWPIIGETNRPAVFLGPIAVDKSAQSLGLGHRLVAACLAALPGDTIILVGDMSFFGEMAFKIVPSGKVMMPNPVDPNRVLWRLADTERAPDFGRLKAAPQLQLRAK